MTNAEMRRRFRARHPERVREQNNRYEVSEKGRANRLRHKRRQRGWFDDTEPQLLKGVL